MCALAFLLKARVSMTHFGGDFNRNRDVQMSSLSLLPMQTVLGYSDIFAQSAIFFFFNIIIFLYNVCDSIHLYIYIYNIYPHRAIEIENREGRFG